MDIVLQGPVLDGTVETARRYLREGFVDRVILSCWTTDVVEHSELSPGIELIHNQPPNQPGQGNVNYQIVSSAAGITASRSQIIAKMRTDQRITSASLRMMHEFVEGYLPAEGGSIPAGPLFVIGAYEHGSYPFHPQDHVFWGYRSDLRALFDAPLSDAVLDDPTCPAVVNYAETLRANLYLGAHYHARVDPRVAEMVAAPRTFLVDGAPRYAEACELSTSFAERIFKVFPRVELSWEKRDWHFYPFDLGTMERECWHEAPW